MRRPSLYEAIVLGFIISTAVWLLVGCAGTVRPEEVVQTRTVTTNVSVPVPVACVSREDVPPLPRATAIDIPTAQVDMKAAAVAADAEQFERCAKAAAALIEHCIQVGGGK